MRISFYLSPAVVFGALAMITLLAFFVVAIRRWRYLQFRDAVLPMTVEDAIDYDYLESETVHPKNMEDVIGTFGPMTVREVVDLFAAHGNSALLVATWHFGRGPVNLPVYCMYYLLETARLLRKHAEVTATRPPDAQDSIDVWASQFA